MLCLFSSLGRKLICWRRLEARKHPRLTTLFLFYFSVRLFIFGPPHTHTHTSSHLPCTYPPTRLVAKGIHPSGDKKLVWTQKLRRLVISDRGHLLMFPPPGCCFSLTHRSLSLTVRPSPFTDIIYLIPARLWCLQRFLLMLLVSPSLFPQVSFFLKEKEQSSIPPYPTTQGCSSPAPKDPLPSRTGVGG